MILAYKSRLIAGFGLLEPNRGDIRASCHDTRMEQLMEPPLTPAQRVAALRHVSDLRERIASVRLQLRTSGGGDVRDVERWLAARRCELSRLRALLAR